MSERPKFVPDLANDFVNKLEDEWLGDRHETLQMLQKRAKGSRTLVAEKEMKSAVESFDGEIERLDPNGMHNWQEDL